MVLTLIPRLALPLNPALLTTNPNISEDLLISGMNSELMFWTAARKKDAALVESITQKAAGNYVSFKLLTGLAV